MSTDSQQGHAVGSCQVPFPGALLHIRHPAAVKYISQFVAGINIPCGLPTKVVDKHAGRRVTLTMSRRPAAVNFVAGLVSVHDRPFASTFFGVNGSAAVKPGCPHQGVAYVAGASPEHPAKLVAGVTAQHPPYKPDEAGMLTSGLPVKELHDGQDTLGSIVSNHSITPPAVHRREHDRLSGELFKE